MTENEKDLPVCSNENSGFSHFKSILPDDQQLQTKELDASNALLKIYNQVSFCTEPLELEQVCENENAKVVIWNSERDDQDFKFFFPYLLNGSANVNSEEHDKQPTDLIYGTCEKDSLEAEMKVKMENVDELEQHDFTNLDERQTNIGMKNEIEPQTVSNEFDQNLGLYYRDNYVNPNNYMYCLGYDNSIYNQYSYGTQPNISDAESFGDPYNVRFNQSQPDKNDCSQMMNTSIYDYGNVMHQGVPYSATNSIRDVSSDSKENSVMISEEQPHSSSGGDCNVLGNSQMENTSPSKMPEDRHSYNYDIKENKIEEMQRINTKYTHQRFPIKLWNLASDENFKPINWSPDGLSLIIDEYSLEPNLGYFFRSKKFSSFLRQLHLYGFRKVTRARNHRSTSNIRIGEMKSRSECISEYQCTFFRRDQLDLVKNVRRFYGNHGNTTGQQGNLESNPVGAADSISPKSNSSLIAQNQSSSPQSAKFASPSQMDQPNTGHTNGCEFYEMIPSTSTTQNRTLNAYNGNGAEYNNYYGINESCSLVEYYQFSTNYQQMLTHGSYA